jgi:hypothetical protein
VKHGKGGWLKMREDRVQAKGKGELTTYWLETLGTNPSTRSGTNTSHSNDGEFSRSMDDLSSLNFAFDGANLNSVNNYWDGTNLKKVLGQTKIDREKERLVEWNVEVLSTLLKCVVSKRMAGTTSASMPDQVEEKFDLGVQMVIEFPEFDAVTQRNATDIDTVRLAREVVAELREYVSAIASGYPKNPFHNFEHVSLFAFFAL